MEAQLGSQPVEAVRIFTLNRETLTLHSLNANELWEPGKVMRSRCHKAENHGFLKPEENCTCGVWSCKSRKELHNVFPHVGSFGTIVSARIQQWGIVIEHQFGYRSEYARIIPETIQWYPRPEQPREVNLLQHLRQKYAGEKVRY